MPKILYVCLSDLHLGAPSALMTDTPAYGTSGKTSADPMRTDFAAALMATLAALNPSNDPGNRPGLVLLGDIFDFSLGTPKSSIDTFTDFLGALRSTNAGKLLSSFVFVPGNHDHELWTASRLQHMVGSSQSQNKYNHTTPAFAAPDTQPAAVLIDQLLRDNGFPAGATTFYPNMGLALDNGKKAVVLHHGHFIEQMYTVMSTLTAALNGTSDIQPDVEALEKLNGSWIDFIWSSDGDDGVLGADIRLGFDYLVTGREDIRLDHRLARELAKTLIARLPIPQTANARQLTAMLSMAAVDSTLGQYGQMERFSYFEKLGEAGREGLAAYLSGPVRLQIEAELLARGAAAAASEPAPPLATDLTFVFGHTHKPFEHRVVAPGFSLPPAVYNTGGWDLDMPMFGTRLGAAAVFIDEDLNVASLRLCDVPSQDDASCGAVRVETADGNDATNPVARLLRSAIDSTPVAAAWSRFTATATAAYKTKQAYVFGSLREEDRLARKTGRTL